MRDQAGFSAQNFERSEQRRRGFAAADGDADRFEHLSGFDAEVDRCARAARIRGHRA